MAEGLLVLRVVVGVVLVMHGVRKLSSAMGGGISRTTAYMASLGMRAPRASAVLAGLTEVGAGVLLGAGALTFLGVAGAVGVLSTAIVIECVRKGFWAKDGGYEFPLVLLAGVVAVGLAGPGSFSVDAHLLPPDWANLSGWPAITLALALTALTALVGRESVKAAEEGSPRTRDRPAEMR